MHSHLYSFYSKIPSPFAFSKGCIGKETTMAATCDFLQFYNLFVGWDEINSHFVWRRSPTGFQVASLLTFLDHTHTHTTDTHKYPVDLLCMSDQLVTQAVTYTAHSKQFRSTFMPSAEFEPAIQRPHTYALGLTATGIGSRIKYGEL